MKLIDTYDGTSDPLEGERALLWTSLPAGAKVTSARLSLAPRDAVFEETIAFDGPQGEWGATKVTGAIVVGGVSRRYVEIDFHKRRTLVSVPPTALVNAALQVDMGGLFVEINAQGAIRTPNDAVFALPADGTLPGLTVTKFRLIAAAGVTAADVAPDSDPIGADERRGASRQDAAVLGTARRPRRGRHVAGLRRRAAGVPADGARRERLPVGADRDSLRCDWPAPGVPGR